MADAHKSSIIIDNGSGLMKAGFSGDHHPSAIFPPMVGRLRHPDLPNLPHVTLGRGTTSGFEIGQDAVNRRGILSLKYPIERGIVTNWEDMELIWRYIFDSQLQTDPKEHPVLLSETSANPKANREKTAEIMFETFGVPAMYLHPQPKLSLYSSGRTSGLVIECGEGVTQVLPVREGANVCDAVCHQMGGRDLTDYLMKILMESGWLFNYQTARSTVHEMKEKLCFTALDFEQEMQAAAGGSEIERKYELLDGEVITVANERFRCPEAMFQPQLLDLQFPGVHQTAFNSLMSCEKSFRDVLAANIVVAGGNSVFPGFARRLEKEMKSLAAGDETVEVSAPQKPATAAWIGGSILGALPTFPQVWTSKQEYEETGAAALEKKP